MLIRNYGIHWERSGVTFGKRGAPGHLNGWRPGAPDTDFRQQIGVYVLSDKDLKPIYIGQAGSGSRTIFDRLKQHDDDHLHNRWTHFSWFGVKRVNKSGILSQVDSRSKIFSVSGRQLLNQIEGVLITALEPRLNKQGARWKDAQQFYQLADDDKYQLTSNELNESITELRHEVIALKKELQNRL